MSNAKRKRDSPVNEEEEETKDDDEDELNCSKILERISTKDYTWETILSQERRGKLNFQPEYQRLFKWKQTQSSLFVESLLMSYPCPEVTFLKKADGKMECLDGQQRLTTLKHYTEGTLPESWKTSRNTNKGFELKNLGHLKSLEGKTFKDLSDQERDTIENFDIRCCIIPESWPFANVIDYFKRIQGGGTKMTYQELRRVMSRGAFTTLLDEIAKGHSAPFSTLTSVFEQSKVRIDPDGMQDLYLRFFTLQSCNPRDFGLPSIQDHMMKTMKKLNEESKTTAGSAVIQKYLDNLKHALELVLTVFTDPHTVFQRPVILADTVSNQAYYFTGRINKNLWDCLLYVFSNKDKASVTENADAIHDALVHLMQTHNVFSVKQLQKKDTEKCIFAVNECIDKLIQMPNRDRSVYGEERRQIICQWLKDDKPCAICNQRLSKFHEFSHVDHAQSLFSGGSTSESNLVVVHKICNLKKGK